MSSVRQWLANHSITSQSVSVAWLFISGLFYTNQDFHDYVTSTYSTLPKGIHAFIAGALIPALIFWKAQKKTTITTSVAPGTETKTEVTTAVKETMNELPK